MLVFLEISNLILQKILPVDFIESLHGLEGFREDDFLRAHATGIPPVSIRLNPFKDWEGKEKLKDAERIPWCEDGFYLAERPSFTSDPVFHGGGYYVQEASSMFLHQVLTQLGAGEPEKIAIDLCAAPGGKSTLLQSLLHSTSLLLSNEVIKTRVGVLQENILKWGFGNGIVTQSDPSRYGDAGPFADYLIVDAPCSGSGLFRKDEDAISQWSLNQVDHCSLRQKRILEQSLPALKPGGYLVYSTCSFSKKENEEIGNWLARDQGLEPVRINITANWNIVETHSEGCFGYRFYPDKLKGEGFFMAAFKKEGMGSPLFFKGKKKIGLTSPKTISEIQDFVSNADGYSLYSYAGKEVTFPSRYLSFLEWALGMFFVKQAGTVIGEMKQGELIPHHALAMSWQLHSHFPKINLNRENALQYLRRQNFELDATPGWKLLTYNHLPLGWAKVLPNRVNNYYPKEWRILNM